MNIINIQQGSKEWLDLRRGKITASKIPRIIDKPKEAMVDHIREILDKPPLFQGNEATRYGQEMEPRAREWYERCYDSVQQVGFVLYGKDPVWGCSPDGFTDDGTRVLEIKCPFSRVIPDTPWRQHIDQVQFEMHVCQKDDAHLLYWTPEKQEVFYLARDDDYFDDLYKIGNEFLFEAKQILACDPEQWLRENQHEPEQMVGQDWREAAEQYLKAVAQLKEAERQKEVWRSRLGYLSQGYPATGAGVRVSWARYRNQAGRYPFITSTGETDEGTEG